MVQNVKKKILLIDNDEFIRILFKDIFWIHVDRENFDVRVVSELGEAEKLINVPDTCPDIIFLDFALAQPQGKFSLENNEGMDFLKKIKSDKKTKDIKIIIFSGYTDKPIVKKAMELGADKFLVKGEFLPKELIELVNSMLLKK